MTAPGTLSATRCTTCNADIAGRYCAQCGEPRPHEGDLAVRHLLHDAVHEITHLDGKIWRTIRALLVEPGRLTREYWEGRRGSWIRPFRLYLTVYLLHLLVFPNVAGPLSLRFAIYQDPANPKKHHFAVGDVAERYPIDVELVNEVQHVYKWAQYASLTLLAGVSYLMSRRRQRYFGAHMILAMHFYSFMNVESGLMSPIPRPWNAISPIITVVYIFLMLRRVFQQGVPLTLLKTVGVFFLFVIIELATIVAIVVAVFLKHGYQFSAV